MTFIKTRGKNGYCIENVYGVQFDFVDIEVWLYLGLDESTTMMIVKGFTDYWRNPLQGETVHGSLDGVASRWRNETLPKLASSPVLRDLVSTPQPFQELHEYVENYSPGGPFAPADDPFEGTELEGIIEERKTCYLKAYGEDRPPLERYWKEAATDLFDEIVFNGGRRQLVHLQGRTKRRLVGSENDFQPRGAHLSTQEHLTRFFGYDSISNTVQWGPLFYPMSQLEQAHFFVAGLSQMGKTTILRLLFQSVYKTFNTSIYGNASGSTARFVLFDAKADLLPKLFPNGPEYIVTPPPDLESDLYLLNPLDARTAAWDIAKDATDDRSAGDIADILFPEKDQASEDEEFFVNLARDFTRATIDALRRRAGDQWTLLDLMCALQGANVLAVLSSTKRGQAIYDQYANDKAHSAVDAIKTLGSYTRVLLPLANAWTKAKRKVSFREWADSDTKSLVLTGSKTYRKGMRRLNRILLDVLSHFLFAGERTERPRTFLYLDEFERLGRLSFITEAVQQGLSQNVNVAMCIHDLGLLRKAYGPEALGLLSQCVCQAFLRLDDPETTEWASSRIGTMEQEEATRTVHFREDGTEEASVTTGRRERRLVIPSEISNLPTPKVSEQITGYFRMPLHDAYRGSLSINDLISETNSPDATRLWPNHPDVAHFIEPDYPILEPDDTFATLYRLDFHKDEYEPQSDQDDVSHGPVETESPKSNEPRSKREITREVDFGDDD